MVFRIAIVQMNVVNDEIDANLAHFEELLEQAAASGAELVVFPEDCVSGTSARITEFADTDGAYRETMQQFAAKYAIDLVPGSQLERDGDGRIYNTAYYIDRDGAVLGRYRKVNLWLSEKPFATRGDGATVCDTRFGRVGLAICWDLAFPDHFGEMFQQRAEIAVCPSSWCLEDAGPGLAHNPTAERLLIDSCCVARAIENEMVMVFGNRAGAWQGRTGPCTAAGHSQVAVPFAGRIGILRHNGEAILLTDVDTSILADAEAAYEIKKDRLATEATESTETA
jgi:predicted amidohydrolase